MTKKEKDASLAEELPYWDFIEGPIAHGVLADGSLVGGLKVKLIDVECFDESETNSFTMGLRSALNSISEGTSLQFVLGVRSDFSDVLDAHREGRTSGIHPLISNIATYRESRLRSAMERGELYRPELFVYLRTPVVVAKKISIFKKKELFTEESAKAYQDTLEVLGQNIETLLTSFESLGLS
jgi:type IV secretory pathway VirB4 component